MSWSLVSVASGLRSVTLPGGRLPMSSEVSAVRHSTPLSEVMLGVTRNSSAATSAEVSGPVGFLSSDRTLASSSGSSNTIGSQLMTGGSPPAPLPPSAGSPPIGEPPSPTVTAPPWLLPPIVGRLPPSPAGLLGPPACARVPPALLEPPAAFPALELAADAPEPSLAAASWLLCSACPPQAPSSTRLAKIAPIALREGDNAAISCTY